MSHPTLPPVTISHPTAPSPLLLRSLAALHRACVLHDHMLATILDVQHPTKLLDYWRDKYAQAREGTRVILVQFADEGLSSSGSSTGEREEDDEEVEREIAGVVMLDMPVTETGPFRGAVEKLMVSPNHRKKGVARRLMAKLEEVASERERYLLMLDTEIGSGAEFVYPKFGYKEVGVVPKYGISPKDGRLVDAIFYYKDLRDVKCLKA